VIYVFNRIKKRICAKAHEGGQNIYLSREHYGQHRERASSIIANVVGGDFIGALST
jgi:hypothetical protein